MSSITITTARALSSVLQLWPKHCIVVTPAFSSAHSPCNVQFTGHEPHLAVTMLLAVSGILSGREWLLTPDGPLIDP